MEDIRVYDFEFNLLHIEHFRISDNWSIYFNDIGTYEGHFSLQSDIVPIVLGNRYLVIVQGDKQAIVTGAQAGQTDFVVYGKTVNHILNSRVMLPFNTYREFDDSMTPEDVARWVLTSTFIEPDDPNDEVENFVLAPQIGIQQNTEGEEEDEGMWRQTAHPVGDVVIDCMANANAGHRLTFDIPNKRWYFECLQGEELTISLAESERNIYDTSLTVNYLENADGGWYEHTIEQETPEVNTVGETPVASSQDEEAEPTTEWLRLNKEDAPVGIYRWVTVLSGQNESEAKSDLKKRADTEEVIASLKNLTFGTDYNLGDFVTVRIEKGGFLRTVQKRVKGINIWYEQNNIGIQPILE